MIFDGALNLVLLLVILVGLVVVHELGHFLAARRADVRVHEFGIGFPPRAAILHRGKLLQQGSVSELTAAVQGKEGIVVRFRTGPLTEAQWASFAERGATREPDDFFAMPLPDEPDITKVIDELRANSVPIFAVQPKRVRLEEAFVEIIKEQGGSTKVEA